MPSLLLELLGAQFREFSFSTCLPRLPTAVDRDYHLSQSRVTPCGQTALCRRRAARQTLTGS